MQASEAANENRNKTKEHKNMKLLMVVDRYPFPPRDGVTIPTAAIATLLHKTNEIDLLVIAAENQNDFPPEPDDTNKIFRSVQIVERATKKPACGIAKEFFLGKPYFSEKSKEPFQRQENREYDYIIASPINVLSIALSTKKKDEKCIALVSDVYTSVLRNSSISIKSLRGSLIGLLQKLRSLWVANLENALLQKADYIFVQTNKDRAWLKAISNGKLEVKSSIFTNGASDDLFSINGQKKESRKIVLFIASFSDPHYQSTLDWFLINVWNKTKRSNKDAFLRIVGRGLDKNEKLYRKVRNDSTIEYIPFSHNLCEIYSSVRIAVAPIFKEYGFINKVAEALAAGIPVVGDASAFNGMEEVVEIGGGYVANNKNEFHQHLSMLLTDNMHWQSSALNARNFAEGCLRWESRRKALEEIIK